MKKPLKPTPGTYKPGEFARLLGIHVKTLQNWDKKGTLRAHRLPSGRRYYTKEQLEAILQG